MSKVGHVTLSRRPLTYFSLLPLVINMRAEFKVVPPVVNLYVKFDANIIQGGPKWQFFRHLNFIKY